MTESRLDRDDAGTMQAQVIHCSSVTVKALHRSDCGQSLYCTAGSRCANMLVYSPSDGCPSRQGVPDFAGRLMLLTRERMNFKKQRSSATTCSSLLGSLPSSVNIQVRP